MPVSFNIVIRTDPSQAVRGISEIERRLLNLGRRANTTSQMFTNLLSFAGASLGITNLVRTLANFEQQLSTLRGVTGASADQFELLRAKARQLGETTKFTATQTAEAMVVLGRAGFKTNQVLGTIAGTLALAQAGALRLSSAANIAAGALRGFRLPIADMARVSDVLAKASVRANTTVLQLGEGLKFVAPVAAGLKVTFEETIAAQSVLADSLLKASVGGTGLRRVLSELETPSKKTRKIFAALGVSTNQVRVSQVGLTQALKVLKTAGVDAGLALKIFQERGGPAFEVLANNIPKLKALNAELQNSKGFALELARIMSDNLNGSILMAKSAFEAFMLSLGEAGATSLFRAIFDTLTSGFRYLAANIEIFISILETLVIYFSIRLAQYAIPLAVAAFNTFTTALMANPIGVLVTGLYLATIALVAFSEQLIISNNGITTLQDLLIVVFGNIAETVTNILGFIGYGYQQLIGLVSDTVSDIGVSFDFVLLVIARAIDSIIGFFRGLIGALDVASRAAATAFQQAFIEAAQAVINAVTAMVNAIISGLNRVLALARQAQIQALKAHQLSKVTAPNPAALSSQIGDIMGSSIENTTFTEDALLRSLEQAEGNALERNRANQIRQNLLNQPLGELPSLPPPSAGGGGAPIDIGEGGGGKGRKGRKGPKSEYEKMLEEAKKLTEKYMPVQEKFRKEQEKLNQMFNAGAISQYTYTRALEDAYDTMLNNSTQAVDGAIKAMRDYVKEANNSAKKVNQVFSKFFRNLEDSMVEFFQTGELNFKKFADDISEGIIRLVAQQAIISPLAQAVVGPSPQALGTGGSFGLQGGGGGLVGSIGSAIGSYFAGGSTASTGTTSFGGDFFSNVGDFFGGFFANGGPVKSNRAYVVGEEGPELFIPDSNGTIIPNGGSKSTKYGASTDTNKNTETNIVNVTFNVTAMDGKDASRVIKQQAALIGSIAKRSMDPRTVNAAVIKQRTKNLENI